MLILKSKNLLFTKIIKKNGGVEDYGNIKTVEFIPALLENVEELYEVLKTLQHTPHCAVVRGQLIDPSTQFGTRTIHERKDENNNVYQKAYIKDYAASWMMFDIDGLGDSRDLLPPTRDNAIRVFREEIGDATFIYQYSAKAGLRSAFKIHYWVYLREPRTCLQCRNWIEQEGIKVFDKGVFTPNQVHYTANPLFEDESMDVVAERMGFVKGNGDFYIPEINTPPVKKIDFYGDRGDSSGSSALNFLNFIANIRVGTAHNNILSAAGSFTAVYGKGGKAKEFFFYLIAQQLCSCCHPDINNILKNELPKIWQFTTGSGDRGLYHIPDYVNYIKQQGKFYGRLNKTQK